ncbi:MAG TPA: hypothetical protein VJM50_10520 [Pyrinomonadaceae bacterium]|nr:hypothetical protein [Pyrinomonadaceae bacterium]
MPRKDAVFLPETGLSPRAEALILLAASLLFFVLALRTFGPDSVYTDFHSDGAILILMANDDRPISFFDTYYYASDRWGTWPLIMAKALHQNIGLYWTPHTLHYARTISVFFGLFVLAALNARAAPAVIVSGLLALCLEPTSRRLMFDVSQLHNWQVALLLLAWFCLRHFLAQRLRSDESKSVRVHGILWGAAFYLSAFFAIWISVPSVPLLAVLVTLEALRSKYLFNKPITTRRIGLATFLLLAATASEFLLKKNYHRYSLTHFDNDFKTGLALDFEYLYQNLLQNWYNIVHFKMFLLIVVAVSFLVGIGGLIFYARIAGERPLLTRVVSFFEDETVTMIVALTAMAAINFVLVISVNHVRLSVYNVRFLALTYLFGSIGGLLTIYLAIRVFANRMAVTRYVLPPIVVCAFILLGVAFPPRALSDDYKVDQQTALTLSQKAPGAVLLGGYWETYLLVGLQPTNTMTPLPLEGMLNRIPWTTAILRESRQVVVEYRKSGVVQKDSLPPNELLQYGNLLKLQEARFYENGPYAFALYLNEP